MTSYARLTKWRDLLFVTSLRARMHAASNASRPRGQNFEVIGGCVSCIVIEGAALLTPHAAKQRAGQRQDRCDAACDDGAGGWPHPSTLLEPVARRRGMLLMSRFSAEEGATRRHWLRVLVLSRAHSDADSELRGSLTDGDMEQCITRAWRSGHSPSQSQLRAAQAPARRRQNQVLTPAVTVW